MGEIFHALVLDKRVKNTGAFKLWHCLYHHRNRETGLCYPGYRTLEDEIQCNIRSIKKWVIQLEDAGWIQVDRSQSSELGGGKSFHYTLCDGKGNPLPVAKRATDVSK
jgi:hypothetical protein